MAKKAVVVGTAGGKPIPFLRGILVQSLTAAGLPFADAYATAQSIRDDVAGRDKVSTDELRTLTAEHLEQRFGAKLRRAYEAALAEKQVIWVRTATQDSPFSVGMLAHYLDRCALDKEAGVEAARSTLEHLQAEGRTEVDPATLQRLVHQILASQHSTQFAERYLSWRRFEKSKQPLILLIGGTSGTGKSTVAAEVAYRLNVVRTQSTDMIREVIRAHVEPRRYPTLDYSSFEAWRGFSPLRLFSLKQAGKDKVVSGFLDQFARVQIGLDATLKRAVKESQHLIAEGIHVLPSELALAEARRKGVLVTILLTVSSKERLRAQFARRAAEQPDRGASRYLAHLDEIWELQRHFLDLADKAAVPVIDNWDVEETVRNVLNHVCQAIGRRFPAHTGEQA